jgi:hypothetical protein
MTAALAQVALPLDVTICNFFTQYHHCLFLPNLSPELYIFLKSPFKSKKDLEHTCDRKKKKSPLQPSAGQKLLSHGNKIQVIRKLAQ